MIQRVQTLFLFAITLFSALMVFLPFQEIKSGENVYELCLNPSCLNEQVKGFIYIPIILNAVIFILSIIVIFLYKNRKQQIKLTQLLLLFSALLIGNLFVMHFIKGDETAMQVNYRTASFFPAVNAVCAFFARRFIKKDEELVRSADRIR